MSVGVSGLRVAVAFAVLAVASGCERTPRAMAKRAPDAEVSATGASAAAAPTVVPMRPPSLADLPDDEYGAAVRRGRAILLATRDSLPGNVGNRLRCMSCHLDEGRRPLGSPLVGVAARYPTYRARSAIVEDLAFRVNDCLRRSMNGRPLAPDSREMQDILTYFSWLSRGVPVGAHVEGEGLPRLAMRPVDTARGRELYAANCAACHGASGEGVAAVPPLWGPQSFNIGAGMARIRTMAGFVRANMPLDRPGSLSDQDAFDVAAYVLSHPRPDFPGKENDWPKGDAPPDAAYPTRAGRAHAPATEVSTGH